jgi:hypothetical protein
MSLIMLTYSSLSYLVLITLFCVDCTVIGVNNKTIQSVNKTTRILPLVRGQLQLHLNYAA